METLNIDILQLAVFKTPIQSLLENLKVLGILSFVLILIIIVMIIMAPTIIALIKKTKNRKIVVIANVITGLFFMISFILPLIIWAILFIAALMGKKELNTTVNIKPKL